MDAFEQIGHSFNKRPKSAPLQTRWSRFVASWKQAFSPNISWWEPYWSHTHRMSGGFRRVFAPRSILRVTIVSLIIFAAITAWVQAAVPGVQFPPLWKMLLSIPIMYAYMAVMLLLHLVIPTSIKVRKDRIHSSTGQSGWVVQAKDIHRTRIVVFAFDRIRLRVLYTRGKRRRSRTFGISSKISLDALCSHLPIYPQVWDARQRYQNKKCGTTHVPLQTPRRPASSLRTKMVPYED